MSYKTLWFITLQHFLSSVAVKMLRGTGNSYVGKRNLTWTPKKWVDIIFVCTHFSYIKERFFFNLQSKTILCKTFLETPYLPVTVTGANKEARCCYRWISVVACSLYGRYQSEARTNYSLSRNKTWKSVTRVRHELKINIFSLWTFN